MFHQNIPVFIPFCSLMPHTPVIWSLLLFVMLLHPQYKWHLYPEVHHDQPLFGSQFFGILYHDIMQDSTSQIFVELSEYFDSAHNIPDFSNIS